ncbi:MAG: hypothetical protein H5U04_05355 [Firmicutes bacterium]|nr:hypothetical protein [Bacillota bacterium]
MYDLYRRWESLHRHPEDKFLGGVAAFNLGKYRQAARIWRRVLDPRWEFVQAYVAGRRDSAPVPHGIRLWL